MYLTQETSALLFSALRIALQISSVFLISHVASRTYNLTLQERINSSSLSQVNYIFFASVPAKRTHYLGRLYVAIVLIVSLVLALLPYFLNKLYPVKDTFLEENETPFNLTTKFIRPTSMTPGQTSVQAILFNMAVPMNKTRFEKYTAGFPLQVPCHFQGQEVHCNGHIVSIGITTLDSLPLIAASRASNDDMANDPGSIPLNATTLADGEFQYFNLTSNAPNFSAMVEMYRVAGQAYHGDGSDQWFNGPRSVEKCLLRTFRNSSCVRHSLGYLVSDAELPFLITRQLFTQTVAQNTEYGDEDEGGDPVPLDCQSFTSPTFQVMCRQLRSLGDTGPSNMFTMQKLTQDPDGTSRLDVVTTYIVNGGFVDLERESLYLIVEAFHLKTTVSLYNSTIDTAQLNAAQKGLQGEQLSFLGQEVFEATDYVPENRVASDPSWTSWGFSEQDLHNLTQFLMQGTLLNSGGLLITQPELLADVSNVVVGLLFGACVSMIALGLFLSHGIPSTVRDPFTEVLPQVLKSTAEEAEVANTVNPFRKRQIANITLLPQPPQSLAYDVSESNLDSGNSNNSGVRERRHRRQQRKLVLQIELDSDNEDDTMRLLETLRDHVQRPSNQSSGSLADV